MARDLKKNLSVREKNMAQSPDDLFMDEFIIHIAFVAIVFGVVAYLYSSVGLGGGSSYTALLAVFGAGVHAIPTISLTLNILVTSVGAAVFLFKGHGRIGLIGPFLIASIPMAYIGGFITLPKLAFYILLFASLSIAAWRIYFPKKKKTALAMGNSARITAALACGGVLGLLAGIVGIGGGVYLVPLVILLGLGTEKEAAACGAVFVWANSIAGLAGRLQHTDIQILDYSVILMTVLLGGLAGSFSGAVTFSPRTMQKVLGSVLVAAIFIMGRKIVSLSLL